MLKMVVIAGMVVSIFILSGIFPHIAVMLTAVAIVGIFVIFRE